MNPAQPVSDGELTYGFDPASPNGDMSALAVRNGSLVFHLFGEEAEAVEALLAQSYQSGYAAAVGDAVATIPKGTQHCPDLSVAWCADCLKEWHDQARTAIENLNSEQEHQR